MPPPWRRFKQATREKAVPVLVIACPDCGHRYRTLVVEGARVPVVWVCPDCKARNGEVLEEVAGSDHPWSGASMDTCCG